MGFQRKTVALPDSEVEFSEFRNDNVWQKNLSTEYALSLRPAEYQKLEI